MGTDNPESGWQFVNTSPANSSTTTGTSAWWNLSPCKLKTPLGTHTDAHLKHLSRSENTDDSSLLDIRIHY